MNIMLSMLLFGLPGGGEWVMIVLIVLVLFGGRKIPELMRGLGQGIREFNNAKSNIKSEINENIRELETQKRKELEAKTESAPENAEK
ncbi:MAG TPA: twin-arginine translocase TatA/TatE family subunit [Saprospiraceae bacterium]|nr:twin-arginine translocase TatA/TatE family subunit [Saprospiraceae bacterium]